MTALRQAAQQALEALEEINKLSIGEHAICLPGEIDTAMDALRAALAEPQRRKTGKPRNATTRLGVVCFEAYARSYVGSNRWDIAAEAVRRAALAEPETCTWQQDGDSDSGVYGTSCRRYFNLEDGTPEDNKMKWCCYCGKKLAQALITEDEDD